MILNNKQTRPVVATGPLGQIVLVPGMNDIPDADYTFIKPALEGAGLFKAKLIEEGPTKEVKDGTKLVPVGKSLAECSPEQASAIIEETMDVKLLNSWKKIEKRDEVRLAIVNRIEAIKTAPTGSEESKD